LWLINAIFVAFQSKPFKEKNVAYHNLIATIGVAAYAGIAARDEFERVCKGDFEPGSAPRGSVGRLSMDPISADLGLGDSMATDHGCDERKHCVPR